MSTATLRAEPIYFGPEGRRLAGWLHRAPVEGTSGVVLCNPFGYEMLCAHRSLRHFAESFAAAGVPALRFDYDGTGDSTGDDLEEGRVRAWVASVVEACRALRERAGVQRVWLLGVRLGALIAALAASEVAAAGLIAIAPVVSGKAHLRELRALHSALGLAAPPDGTAKPDVDEAIGFAITEETRKALTEIDLVKLASAPAPEVLVLDRSDLPSGDKWIARLAEQGAKVDARRVDGYVEMVLDPHKTVVPTAMIEAATQWLRERAGEPAPRSRAEVRSAEVSAEIGDVIERPVFMDDAGRVFGYESSPRSISRTGRAILLLNAGAIHHVGPNRLHVRYARAWAGAGDLVVRMDITGIGESPTRPGSTENVVYSETAVGDVDVAIRWLRRQPSVKDVWAIGLCSGAYHAFKGAVAGQPMTGFVAINPLTFFWTPDSPLDPAAHKVIEESERYWAAAFDPDRWKRLLQPEVRDRVIRTLSRQAKSLVLARTRDLARRINMPFKGDLAAELEDVAKRGVELNFIFAKGDPGEQLLRRDGGSVVRTLSKRRALDIDVVAGPDHTFTSLWSHAPLFDLLGRAMATSR